MAHHSKCNCAECTLVRGGEICKGCKQTGDKCLCLEEAGRVKYIWTRASAFSPVHMAQGKRTFCGLPLRTGGNYEEVENWEDKECKLCQSSVMYANLKGELP